MDGDHGQFVSDDEDLDREEGTSVLDSLRKGILPPEIRVMYGLALIGEGGRNFLASKCLEAIEDLDQETGTWFTEGERETEISGEPRIRSQTSQLFDSTRFDNSIGLMPPCRQITHAGFHDSKANPSQCRFPPRKEADVRLVKKNMLGQIQDAGKLRHLGRFARCQKSTSPPESYFCSGPVFHCPRLLSDEDSGL